MRFSIAAVALFAVSTLGVGTAQGGQATYGICSCFTPQYDASCCLLVKGYMQNDGNVCSTPDDTGTVNKYEACCKTSGGHSKCKFGYINPNSWPPKDTYSCQS